MKVNTSDVERGQEEDNKLLSRATLVTNIGDWITYFVSIFYLHQITNSTLIAANSVPIRSLGMALGAVTGAKVIERFGTKRVMIVTQSIAALLSFCLTLGILALKQVPPSLVLLSAFLSAVGKYLFDVARETHSKGLAHTQSEHRTLQSQILGGLAGAQFIGPLLALVAVQFAPVWSLYLADGLTFVAAVLVLRALAEGQDLPAGQAGRSINRPTSRWNPILTLGEFQKDSELSRIFLLRTLSHWIPIGLANYLIFSLVTERFGESIELSVVIYSMTGLGGVITTSVLSGQNLEGVGLFSRVGRAIRTISDYRLAALGLCAWFPVRLGFALPTHFWLAVPTVILSGICNSVVGVSTQSLRRKACPSELFPRYLATEIVTARLIEWAMGSLAVYVIKRGAISAHSLYIVGASLFVVAGGLHEWAGRRSKDRGTVEVGQSLKVTAR